MIPSISSSKTETSSRAELRSAERRNDAERPSALGSLLAQ